MERELLSFVLPADRVGYARYREGLDRLVVLGEGRRGRGHLILGTGRTKADNDVPLSHVVAYGAVEATSGEITITVREFVGDQLDVEILSTPGDGLPVDFEEKRRWTYSSWTPGQPSPQTGIAVREIQVDDHTVLAAARAERRLWVYSGLSGMTILIPITGFYAELMAFLQIRDPARALHPGNFFGDLEHYTDRDLRGAFLNYNKRSPKVEISTEGRVTEPGGWRKVVQRIFGGEHVHG
jgi:hypothetical protein